MATVPWCREAVAIVASSHHSFLFRRPLDREGIESVRTNAARAAVVDLTE
jgi:hypothetical protein